MENFLDKPTHVTKFHIKMEPRHFPVVTICPIPSFNQSGLNKHGYNDSYDYAKGQLNVKSNDHSMLNWSGLTNNIEKVLDDISILKTEDNCPGVDVVFEEDEYENIRYLSSKLTRAFPPYGKCCEVKIPSNAANETLLSLAIIEPEWIGNQTYKGFRVFLSNQESHHNFFKNKFNINGPKILAEFKEKIFTLYNVKISEKISLAADKKESCKNYASVDDFSEVINDLCSYDMAKKI